MKISALLIVSVLSVLVVGLCVGIEPHTTPVKDVDLAAMGLVNSTTAQVFDLGPNNSGINGTSVILVAGKNDLGFQGHQYPVNETGEFISIDRMNQTVFIRADGYEGKEFVGYYHRNILEFGIHLRGDVQIGVPKNDSIPAITFPAWIKDINMTVNLRANTVTVNIPAS